MDIREVSGYLVQSQMAGGSVGRADAMQPARPAAGDPRPKSSFESAIVKATGTGIYYLTSTAEIGYDLKAGLCTACLGRGLHALPAGTFRV